LYKDKNKYLNPLYLFLLICLTAISSCTPASNYPRKKSTRKYRYKTKVTVKHKNITRNRKLDVLIERYWGKKYKFGATGPNRFDCSGFVQRIFKEAYKYKLPRTSRQQYKSGTKISKSSLKYADLVFFKINSRKVSHVGVYIGNNKFAHASTSKGVTISSLRNVYYKKRFVGARRVL